jgi:hypothetical protein
MSIQKLASLIFILLKTFSRMALLWSKYKQLKSQRYHFFDKKYHKPITAIYIIFSTMQILQKMDKACDDGLSFIAQKSDERF